MNFIKKIFGLERKKESEEEERGKFMPEPDYPIDELFVHNFRDNGGKFIYCENEDELQQAFNDVLGENHWEEKLAYYYCSETAKRFEAHNIRFTNQPQDAQFFITNCEYLIANTGAILISSKQIGDKRLEDIPYDFIVVAKTSELLETIGEGLQQMKSKYKNSIPSNITTLKTFENKNQSDFLSYGSTTKNLYLLLLEDL
ncbi:LUD domain-containing protein [Psychroflexus halocasei]|uniref:L-lactate utilization protein LutC, contains LUD domain n=1 Tax=Psychroflexus halocasei TaxID=908615 RepID=A0A1H3WQ21_9FLAO|nr:LUD domain-containing protein [Psychroflexus halocasei]SDZ89277.1 L-lactate utilization protein LutC, contains LUD domain [Psychroflexus halocasei]